MKNKIDPICGMKGTIKAHGHYFCSENCLRKYEKKHKLKKCATCLIKAPVWYKEKVFIFGIITILLFAFSSPATLRLESGLQSSVAHRFSTLEKPRKAPGPYLGPD